MEYKISPNGDIYLRIAKGEELLKTIQNVCTETHLTGGYFSGIGAFGQATLATYIPEDDDFINHELTGMLELVSLSGNISLDAQQQPFLHAHASFSFLDDQQHMAMAGGHLKAATVRYTGEVVISNAQLMIQRQFDADAGIDVWQLNS